MEARNNSEHIFIKASEVAAVMEVSLAFAYKIINSLNGELEAQGYIVMSGRTNRKYFFERIYDGAKKVGA